QTQIVTDNESNVALSGSVAGSTPDDPDLTNDAADFGVEVEAGTDVFLRKSRQPSGLLYTGQEVTFTLTPDFAGNLPADAVITDVLPENYEFVGVDEGGDWVCEGGRTVNCTWSG